MSQINTRQQQNIAMYNTQHNMKLEQDMNPSFRNRNGSTLPTTATAVYIRFLRPAKIVYAYIYDTL